VDSLKRKSRTPPNNGFGSPSPREDDLTDSELLEFFISQTEQARSQTFVCTSEAAAIAGVSQRTVQGWIDSGVIRAVAVGKKYRVLRESLHGYLLDCAEKPNR